MKEMINEELKLYYTISETDFYFETKNIKIKER